jgi:hypothetical protein
MAEYGDASLIKQKSGVSANDLEEVSNQTDLDAMILDLNQRASEAVERFCNRDFKDHPDETVEIDGNDRVNDSGNGELKLPGQPVRSISSIEINGSAIDSSEYRLKEPTAYDTDTPMNAGIVKRKNTPFPEGWENVKVTFTWGFQTPPAGVQHVVEGLVVDALRAASRNASAETAESVSMDGFSITYFTGQIEREQKHKDRLNKYRRIALGRS